MISSASNSGDSSIMCSILESPTDKLGRRAVSIAIDVTEVRDLSRFWIMEAVFRVRQIVGGLPHLAEVAVTVDAAVANEITVSDDAFDWRRDVHGPNTVVGGPADQRLAAEAVDGVRYVLERLGVDGGYRVRVTRIWDTPVDTGIGDVKVAAALATCKALGVELEP